MRRVVFAGLLLWMLSSIQVRSARADFLDDDLPRAAELAQRRHRAEVRRLEAWLRSAGLSAREIARRLAAMDDDDVHEACAAPATLWVLRSRFPGQR